jgi:threonine aldolase
VNFASDNVYGVHPKIMSAIVEANLPLTETSYCHDEGSKQAEMELSRIFEKDVKAFLVLNGTGANSLALSAIAPPYGAVFCHEESHIATDECAAPELFTGGTKLVHLRGSAAKFSAETFKTSIGMTGGRGEHGPKPSAVSISNVSELGAVYSLPEMAAIAKIAKQHDMRVHLDGARFANALVSLNCSPAEMTWKSGVDVLSFGGTKNGAMMLEAVVFFDPILAKDFLHRRKRGAQHLSKGRYLSAQMIAYLKDGLWLENARTSNARAKSLAGWINQIPDVRISQPVQANEVFAYMPKTLYEDLEREGVHFYEWPVEDAQPGETHVRFVLSFATPEQDVERFGALVKKLI